MTRAHEWLVNARHLFVLTGAGVSAESGIPTFRDAQTGLWARYDPLDLATPEAFARDPVLVWQWYAHRREIVARAAPNAAHQALARWQSHRRMSLVTQNVDGLHARAGSRDVIELHGNLFANQWFNGCGRCPIDVARTTQPDRPPACARCGALLRPGVVWFGEALPAAALDAAYAAAADSDVCLVVGTSGLVYPAAGLPSIAAERGARVIVVNPQRSDLDHDADIVLYQKAAECLPILLADAGPAH
ncbi:NAD-dependent deacylase [Pararobbsia silviterrae]|uniref:NAD-dependent protein deacylase n=2 Tax=Pararobbsia silviterrae TaxID=1792498 RepID=A0A494XS61_9BURK|nr:NAD-dependent deacylase [Pararobbsia silviterrae]RKP50383.1 NAD-dependent deacylase [Pararobbsia silviterrae]